MTQTHQRETWPRDRLFFAHIMKTGGYSLATQMWRQYPRDRIYGGYGPGEAEFLTATYLYLNPRPLAQLSAEAIDSFRVFGGHFPYAARSLMGDDVVTMTVLRDPVDRVISLLKHAQSNHSEHRALSLEEIFEDEWYFTRFFDNQEVKLFAMTTEEMLKHSTTDGWEQQGWTGDQRALLRRWREDPASLSDDARLEFHNLAAPEISNARGVYRLIGAPNTAEVEVDDARLSQAIENLEQVDIVGTFEQYDTFLHVVSSRCGFDLQSDLRRNVSRDQAVSNTLRTRIANQLGPSAELYEVASRIQAQRAR